MVLAGRGAVGPLVVDLLFPEKMEA